MVWTSCACAAVIPCLFGRKLAPHFGLQINTVSLRLEHIIFTSELKNHPHKVTKSCSCALKSSRASLHLLFGKVQLSPSLCTKDFQWYISHRRRQAVWSDNKQKGVRRREVIKTCSHIIITTLSPFLHLSFFSLHCLSLSLSFSLSDERAFSDCMGNENDGEADKKKEEKKWKVVLKWFATLVGFPLLTFQFKQTIRWLGDAPSLGIHGGESAAHGK